MSKNYKTSNVTYYKRTNTIKFKINSNEVIPQYLYYLLDYLDLPKNATLRFKDKTILGGVEQWLKDQNDIK